MMHTPGTCRLTKDCDVVWITAKCRDVALHPLQRDDLIRCTVVSRYTKTGFGRRLGVRHVTKHT